MGSGLFALVLGAACCGGSPATLATKLPADISNVGLTTLSRDGDLLAYTIHGASEDSAKDELWIYDLIHQRRSRVAVSERWPLTCCSFSPDGRALAVGNYNGSLFIYRRLADSARDTPENKWLLSGEFGTDLQLELIKVAFLSGAERALVVGTVGGTIVNEIDLKSGQIENRCQSARKTGQ